MALNYVTLAITAQDAGNDPGTGLVTIAPTAAVVAAGQTVVSQQPVSRALSSGTVSVQLVACDNTGTTPAAGFWAYQITLPGGQPAYYLVNYANGATQQFANLVPVVAQTTYGPSAPGYLPLSGGTMAGALDPAVVALTDAATIIVNAAAGNDFRVTLGGNRTMGAPSSPADGQKITFEIIQDATGSRTLTWASAYSFGSGSAPTLSTAAAAADLVAFRYSTAKSKLLYLGSQLGF